MHNSNHTKRYTHNYYFTRTKHDCTSAKYILKFNISFTGRKQRTVGFPQRKPLPRSTANSSVSVCTLTVSLQGQLQTPQSVSVRSESHCKVNVNSHKQDRTAMCSRTVAFVKIHVVGEKIQFFIKIRQE